MITDEDGRSKWIHHDNDHDNDSLNIIDNFGGHRSRVVLILVVLKI